MKQGAALLCDYSRVEDPTHEATKMLEASEVTKRIGEVVSSRTIVTAEGAVEAFSANFQPNLVSHLDPFPFLR